MVRISVGLMEQGGDGVGFLDVEVEWWWRGRKFSAWMALGMTDTMKGSREARRTVFSLLF